MVVQRLTQDGCCATVTMAFTTQNTGIFGLCALRGEAPRVRACARHLQGLFRFVCLFCVCVHCSFVPSFLSSFLSVIGVAWHAVMGACLLITRRRTTLRVTNTHQPSVINLIDRNQYALDTMPREKIPELYADFVQLEKKHGDRAAIEVGRRVCWSVGGLVD